LEGRARSRQQRHPLPEFNKNSDQLKLLLAVLTAGRLLCVAIICETKSTLLKTGMYPSVARVESTKKATNVSRPGDRNPNNPDYKLKTRGSIAMILID
jgi:hypothetical protein